MDLRERADGKKAQFMGFKQQHELKDSRVEGQQAVSAGVLCFFSPEGVTAAFVLATPCFQTLSNVTINLEVCLNLPK